MSGRDIFGRHTIGGVDSRISLYLGVYFSYPQRYIDVPSLGGQDVYGDLTHHCLYIKNINSIGNSTVLANNNLNRTGLSCREREETSLNVQGREDTWVPRKGHHGTVEKKGQNSTEV